MKTKHLILALAATGMVAGPAVAAPVGNPAASLSLTSGRAAAPAQHKAKIAGISTILIVAIVAAVGVGIYFAARSTSP